MNSPKELLSVYLYGARPHSAERDNRLSMAEFKQQKRTNYSRQQAYMIFFSALSIGWRSWLMLGNLTNFTFKLISSYFSFSANKGVLECVLLFFFLEVRQSFLTSISSCLSPHVLTVCAHQVSPLARLINELNLSSHMKSNEAHWAQHEFLTETTETKVSAKATKIFGACCEEWVVKIQEFLFTIEFYCADVKTCC